MVEGVIGQCRGSHEANFVSLWGPEIPPCALLCLTSHPQKSPKKRTGHQPARDERSPASPVASLPLTVVKQADPPLNASKVKWRSPSGSLDIASRGIARGGSISAGAVKGGSPDGLPQSRTRIARSQLGWIPFRERLDQFFVVVVNLDRHLG